MEAPGGPLVLVCRAQIPSCQAQDSTGRLFALVTSGFATRHGLPGLANTLCAVDVSDPASPVETCRVRAGVPRTPEGIFVSGDTAYVGGCSSNRLAAFDLRNLAEGEMSCVGALADPTFKQCIGQNTSVASPPRCRGVPDGAAVLLAALWATPAGGLGIFALPANGQPPTELSRLVLPQLALANRVIVLEGGTRVLLPLEAHPGGIALVDVAVCSSAAVLAAATPPLVQTAAHERLGPLRRRRRSSRLRLR